MVYGADVRYGGLDAQSGGVRYANCKHYFAAAAVSAALMRSCVIGCVLR
jgi:hypothetical protein